MTLEELLKKNARIRKEREEKAKRAQKESEKGKKIIKKPAKKEEPVDSSDDMEILTEEIKPAGKKRGRKPANREYMVVEDIEQVND